jgi:NodT family efflux transporter outer membrane factor (OMF) lipoprotein
MQTKWIIGSALFLSGCLSLSKQQQSENILPAPSVNTSVKNSLETPYFSTGDWPEERWWEIFHSPQLNGLVEIALAKNPSIEAIEKRISFAKETAKIAKAKLFPLLSFDANDNWQHLSHHGLYRALNPTIPVAVNLVDLTLSFSYEFDFWGKYRNLFMAALGRQKAEEAESAQVKLITTAALAQSYFALKANLLKEASYQKLYELRKRVFELQELMQKEALFSRLPPLLSQEDVWEAEKDLSSIREEIAIDRHLINILMGRGPDEAVVVDELMPPLPQTLALPENLSVDLLARRPDLMAQIWRVESLAHDVGAAKAEFFPNVKLNAFLGLESTLFSKLFHGSSGTAGVEPAIHLPIFTAGAIRANIQAKKALFDDAVYEYNNLLLKSAQEVADLLAIAKSVFERKQDQLKIVGNAQKRLELTELRKCSGLDSALDEYAFAIALVEKELVNIDLLYSQYLAAVKLIKALGGGYSSDYLPIKRQP